MKKTMRFLKLIFGIIAIIVMWIIISIICGTGLEKAIHNLRRMKIKSRKKKAEKIHGSQ